MIHSVAVIGIGAMGAPMARRVLAAGFELTVCDRNETAVRALHDAGAGVALQPADCAVADLAVIMVATPEQLHEVVLGPNGVVSGLAGDRAPILAVMSTVPVASLKSLEQALTPRGIRLIDAPVSGGALRAEHGTLTVMLGGRAEDIASARPVFSSMGSRLFECGGLGSAQTMKIVNNILGIANAVLSAEAYRLAMEKGLDLFQVARVLDVSTGRNFLSEDPAGLPAVFATMAESPGSFASMASILRKDIGLANDLAASVEGDYPAIRGFKAVVDSLGEETFANWRHFAAVPAAQP